MKDVLRYGKKLFSVSVASLTIAWSMGLSALVPMAVSAATCPSLSSGDLFKVKGNAAVYLVSSEGKRLYFPTGEVYKTWYADYSGIVEIDSSCVDSYPSGGAVNFRPGSRLVKTPVSPSVFVVLPGNVKAKLANESVASALYGSNWNKIVRDLADVFDSNYAVGSELTEAVPHNGQLIKKSGSSDVYYVWGGMAKKVDGTLPSYLSGDVRTVSESVFGKVAMDASTVTASTVTSNVSQRAGGTTTNPTTPTAAGSVTVSLAADTPAAGTVAYPSQARVPFTKVSFTAGNSAVTIDSFKVVRGGVGVDSDFSTVNAVDQNGNLLNDSGKSLNSDSEATFTEDVVVPANSTVSITLVGDMAAFSSGGNTPKLGVAEVTTSASVSASFPIYGNAVATNSSISLATATVEGGSTIGTVTKEVGATNVNFANLKVTAGGSPSQDMQLEKVVLYNSGTASDGDVGVFKLKYLGNVIAEGTLSKKYLSFNLASCGDSCKIPKGDNRTYEVYGDIVGGSGRTVDFDVQRTSHVLVRDLKYNAYRTITNSASGMSNQITISSGKVNVTKSDVVKSGNVSENASGTALASWNFHVTGEPINFRTLVFRITTTGTAAPEDVDSLVLYDASGKALIGAVDGVGATSASVGYATTTDSFTLPVGDNVLTLKGKLATDVDAGDTVRFSVDMRNSTNFDARGENTNDTITLNTYATPMSAVDANLLTVRTSALRVTTLPTPAATTLAAGTSGVTFSKVLLDASDSSEDIKCSSFTTVDATNGGAISINVQNIRLWVDKDGDSYNANGDAAVELGEVKSGSNSDGTDETFTFNLSSSDQFTVKAGSKLIVTVKGNIVGGATVGSHTFSSSASDTVSCVGTRTNSTVTETVDTGATGQAMSVGTAGGTVQVSLDASNPTAKQYVAGTSGVTLGVFKFYSTSTENVEIDKVYFTQQNTTSGFQSYQDYSLLYLVDEAGVTVGSVTPTSTKPLIDLGDSKFVVDVNDSNGKLLYLKANLSSIGSNQAVTVGGHRIGHKINAVADVIAKGAQSGTASVAYFSSSDAPTGGVTHYMYKGTPKVAMVDLPASSKLVVGSNEVLKFNVTADGGDIGLYKFTFDITTTSARVTGVELVDITNDPQVVLYTADVSGNTSDYLYINALFDTDSSGVGSGGEQVVVANGATRKFVLKATVASVATTQSAVSARLAGDSANPTTAGMSSTYTMASATAVDADSNDDFIWSDLSVGDHTTSTNDWINGYLVSGLNSASSSQSVVGN